jgi:ribosome-associated translation inhibitor RaiA
MQIFFQTKKLELHEEEKSFMARRIEGLNKFFSPYAYVYIDVEQTRASHNGRDLYYVSIKIDDGKYKYFTEEYQDGVRKAFDHAYGDMYRVVRKDKGKARAVLKSAGRRFKRIFKRKAK